MDAWTDLPALHARAVAAELGLAVVVVLALVFVSAPYGRHERAGWGPTVSNLTGWLLMEVPACLGFAAFHFAGDHAWDTTPLVLFALWQSHYVYRTFVFPFRLASRHKRMPLSIALLGTTFNSLNAFVNAVWIGHLGAYPDAWLADPRFLLGTAVFLAGMSINRWADEVLLRLRSDGGTGYRVPHGGLYERVSCPNYLGEIVQWCGWALATWSLAGVAFAVYTVANLAPRARTHHQWYREAFPDYPPGRRALIPGLF